MEMDTKMEKLKAKAIPYSSTVGGGIMFTDENGRACFQLGVFGYQGITKEQTQYIVERLMKGWDAALATAPVNRAAPQSTPSATLHSLAVAKLESAMHKIKNLRRYPETSEIAVNALLEFRKDWHDGVKSAPVTPAAEAYGKWIVTRDGSWTVCYGEHITKHESQPDWLVSIPMKGIPETTRRDAAPADVQALAEQIGLMAIGVKLSGKTAYSKMIAAECITAFLAKREGK